MSRLARPTGISFYRVEPPFSNFQFVDDQFGGAGSIRRLLSLARGESRHFKTLVVEEVPAAGAVQIEIEELSALYTGYTCGGIRRLSFWRTIIGNESELDSANPGDCVGWAIVKHDKATIPTRPAIGRWPERKGKTIERWHVFESVIVKYDHRHNYAPGAPKFPVQIGNRAVPFVLPGWMYCQQNRLNKCCAQVAIRTLATAYLGDPDLDFRRINQLIPKVPQQPSDWLPGDGLTPRQISEALKGLGIVFDAISYPERPEAERARENRPYQRYLYSGVESGCGALLAFELDGPATGLGAHIIPAFGHTFNEDTWAPRGEGAYFRFGERIKYTPSESWTSSFIVHDDNFGSDFCLPRRCIRRRHVSYAVALRPPHYAYGGIDAEVAGSGLLYSVVPKLQQDGNPWLKRLVSLTSQMKGDLVLRTVPIRKSEYEAELRALRDWGGTNETDLTITSIVPLLKERMWMIEVSVPDLFATNLRKIGELLLASEISVAGATVDQVFVFGRFPKHYVFYKGLDANNRPEFFTAPSSIESHTRLFRA